MTILEELKEKVIAFNKDVCFQLKNGVSADILQFATIDDQGNIQYHQIVEARKSRR